MNLTEQEKALIRELQRGFKLERRPFLRAARAVDMTEDGVIAKVVEWLKTGVVRRVGIAVRPQKVGNAANALVAWQVPAERVEEVGTAMAKHAEVSHCYERECPPGWPYNLFTMIHASDEEQMGKLLARFEETLGLATPKVLRTVRELKKSSMRYFEEKAE